MRKNDQERERENLARRHASLSNADEGKLARMHNIARSAFRFRWEYEDVNESRSEMTPRLRQGLDRDILLMQCTEINIPRVSLPARERFRRARSYRDTPNR